ncbi:GntR family transcriptional regulator [bacterium]|nr:GntR family transcriptional regulator [bacterium]
MIEIKRDSSIPLYKQIYLMFKKKIEKGLLLPGEKIPSELELNKALKVSRYTIRAALNQLVQEGYLKRKDGKGTFVSKPVIKKKKETVLIGVVVYKADNVMESPLLRYLTSVFSKKDVLLTIYQVADHGQLENTCDRILKNGKVDGVIASSVFSEEDVNLIKQLQNSGIPVVILGRRIDNVKVDWIIVDGTFGAYHLTKYLIESGHEKIVLLVNEPPSSVVWDRIAGYKSAFYHFGKEVSEELIVDCGTSHFENSEEMAYRKMKEILKWGKEKKPTAIFAISDAGAIGVIKSLTEDGYKVPDDFSVVGFDNIPLSRHFSLTTVETPFKEMAEIASGIIMERIRKNKIIPETPYKKIVKPKVIIRNSVKKLRGGVK